MQGGERQEERGKNGGRGGVLMAGRYVDPLTIAEVRYSLEESRILDRNNGFDPRYTIANHLAPEVLGALCANDNCMAAIGDRIAAEDLADNR